MLLSAASETFIHGGSAHRVRLLSRSSELACGLSPCMSDTWHRAPHHESSGFESARSRGRTGGGFGCAPLPNSRDDVPTSWTPRDELVDSISLVRRIQSDQDRRALEELTRRYLPRLERKVRVMMSPGLRQRFEIDDIVQSALLSGIRKLESFEFREPASLIHWLTQIALNEVRSRSRSRPLQQFAGDLGAPSGESAPNVASEGREEPPEQVALKEARALCDEAVGRLPAHYRDVILARDYDGGSWAHVAEIVGRSPEACQMIRKRAKAQLLRMLRGLEL